MQVCCFPIRLVPRGVLAGVLAFLPATGFPQDTSTKAAKEFRPDRWETTIRAFEAADQTNPPPPKAVEFIGSSSIRKWTNAPAQFPKHKVFLRGFGGSHLSDSVAFADRIVIPYQPGLILLYAGDNDIAAGKSPQQVFADFKSFVAKVHASLPRARIAFIAIKPSPSREKFLAPTREANRLIREFIAGQERLIYLDVFTPMLNAEGRPRPDLFLSDRLHLNDAGYKLWASIVSPILDEFDPPSKP